MEDTCFQKNSLLHEFFICPEATINGIIMKFYSFKKLSTVGLYTNYVQLYTLLLYTLLIKYILSIQNVNLQVVVL